MFGEIVQQIADISKEVAGACDDVSDQLLMSPQLKYTTGLSALLEFPIVEHTQFWEGHPLLLL